MNLTKGKKQFLACITLLILPSGILLIFSFNYIRKNYFLKDDLEELMHERSYLISHSYSKEDELVLQVKLREADLFWEKLRDQLGVFHRTLLPNEVIKLVVDIKEFVQEVHQRAKNKKKPIFIDIRECFGFESIVEGTVLPGIDEANVFLKNYLLAQYLLGLLLDVGPNKIISLKFKDKVIETRLLNIRKATIEFSGYTDTLRSFLNNISNMFVVNNLKVSPENAFLSEDKWEDDSMFVPVLSLNESRFVVELLCLDVES